MNSRLIQFSAVVTGRMHNPSILNPDFLADNGIVPRAWGWGVEETVTTPPFAQVRYTNGTTVTVEFEKLQVADAQSLAPGESRVGEIVKAYVQTLSHVRYIAVGVNFQSMIEVPSPEEYVCNRFLKTGPWGGPARPLIAAGIRLVYRLGDGGRLTVALDPGEAPCAAGLETGLIANANFHRDCGAHPAIARIAAHLDKVHEDWSTYCAVLEDVVGDKEQQPCRS